jgi:hypothetical protein
LLQSPIYFLSVADSPLKRPCPVAVPAVSLPSF